jgi:hypothetical protein
MPSRAILRRMRWVASVALVASATLLQTGHAELSQDLRILVDGYPQAFFFRASEGVAANPRVSYEQWETTFERLSGIMGKVLDEEVPGRSARNIDFFTRFKERHPEQVVLLHYNGRSRDPRFQTEEFFAGHWIYFNGSKVLSDVPAEKGEMEIRVADPGLYHLNVGRYRRDNEDIGIFMLDGDGRPDWSRCEQVQLLSVDYAAKTIRVRRGCYGTEPRYFPADKSYAAAHVTEGPWGKQSHLLWLYNYSTRCPRDAEGRSCANVHADDLASRFLAEGELSAFDGLEFDVLTFQLHQSGERGADCDGDGDIDHGIFKGLNTYGIGVVEFCRLLREKLGEETLIMADGHGAQHQRCFGTLNGIESEGWPNLSDWEIRDWSGGLNRHFFWARNGRDPPFSYVNHKFTTAGEEPGSRRVQGVGSGIHRLVFAAAMFTDSAICYSYPPPKENGELFGIWDELQMGVEHRLGWLGHPVGSAVRVAKREPDLLDGLGSPPVPELLSRLHGESLRFAADNNEEIQVSAADSEVSELRFRLEDVPCRGPDLFVSLKAHAAARTGYPTEVARLMWVGIAASEAILTRPELPQTGMKLRGAPETDLEATSGAIVRWAGPVSLGGEEHSAYFVHPPYLGGKTGFTFWERQVFVPTGGRLDFFVGMGERSPERSDGVTFRIAVGETGDIRTESLETIFEHVQKAFEWTHHTVSLEPWERREVRLRFLSDSGPEDDATTDHSFWGNVCILGPGGRDIITEPVQFMTWLNESEFESGFYFSNIRAPEVDLEFVAEGGEPLWITSLTVHPHPDVIYRDFEHGLVLANPAPRPYCFNLTQLFPNQSFRRLRGSPHQDPKTNDGLGVVGLVELAAKDGLFLLRMDPEFENAAAHPSR